jgi:hypothetical protein
MKPVPPATAPLAAPSAAAKPAPIAAALAAREPKPADLGIAERRHFIRPLPTPQAVESDGDTDWAVFQSLLSDK